MDVGDMDNFIVDFVNLFRISKRSIEYLVYSQNYLKSTIIALESKIQEIEGGNLAEKKWRLEGDFGRARSRQVRDVEGVYLDYLSCLKGCINS